ncbi:MAG: PAS domain S-box protein, partial [Candidatus Kapaibacterium sp.]
MNKELKSRESLQAELDEARKEIAFLRDELRLPAPEIGAANSSVLDDLEIRITELQAQNDELREAQDKLRETLGKYYDYFDSAPAAYFILDKNGFIKEINRAFAEMTGSSKKELSGKHLLFIINDDFQKVISDKLSLLADGENYQHCTVKINSGNNRSFFVKIECHQPVYGGDIRCIATGVNELANTAEAFKSVLENSPQGILIIKDDKIVYANQRISDLSGYAKDDFIGRDALKLSDFVHHDERVTMMSRYRKKMRLEDISAKYEYRLLRKDGSVKWIELCSDIIEYEGGTALQAALIDIHDRKISEEKLKEINFELDKRVVAKAKDLEKTLFELDQEILINKKTNDELVNTKKELDKLLKIEQDLNEIKDRFISTISHEYRTPLTIIMSSTYLIRQFLQHGNSEEIIKQLEKVRKSVKTLTGLIDNIVNLEHVDSPA